MAEAIDPRTPVLVGVGQVSNRVDAGADALEPVELMVEALRHAEADAGTSGLLAAVDSMRVMALLSWRYQDPGALVAERLGATPRETVLTVMGGNYPQTAVNKSCLDIAAGRADIIAITGAEAWRTRTQARAAGLDLGWTTQDATVAPTHLWGADDPELFSPFEASRGVFLPVQLYPLFDVALRASLGLTVDEHRDRIAGLWSRFSEVAAANPNAWIRQAATPADLREPSPSNRMVGFPYTKLLNSNNNVEQGAALLLCSVEKARALGISEDRWVFVHAGADAHDHWFVSNRGDLHSSPAMRATGQATLDLAQTSIDEVAHVDLYSCFPSAVQVAAAELGLDLERQLTVTGGMSFAGGPWNNYVTHSIATMADVLRHDPGSTGLVTANGGYLTKHAMGIYSTTPPAAGVFRHADCQAEVDASPRCEAAEGHVGDGMLEAYTVTHDRDGAPEVALAAIRVDGDRRTWGRSTDQDLLAELLASEGVGRTVALDAEGTFRA